MTANAQSQSVADTAEKKKTRHASRGWDLFAHDADIGVRGYGKTLENAFEEAACTLSGVVTDIRHVRRTTCIDIVCNAPNDEMLLYEWLNTIIYEMAAHDMIFARFAVQIHHHGLTA